MPVTVRPPGEGVSGGSFPWLSAMGCVAVDDSATYPNPAAASEFDNTNVLRARNFGFEIPSDGLIVGAKLKGLWLASGAGNPWGPALSLREDPASGEFSFYLTEDGVNPVGDPIVVHFAPTSDGLAGDFEFPGEFPAASAAGLASFGILVLRTPGGLSCGIEAMSLELTWLPPFPDATELRGVAGDSACYLTWDALDGIAAYQLLRSDSVGGSYATVVYAGAATAAVDFDVANGVDYYYVVVGVNERGSGANSNEVHLVPAAAMVTLDAPVIAAFPDVGQVVLTWKSVAGADSYAIYRGTECGDLSVFASDVNMTRFSDEVVVLGATYCYEVQAVGSIGVSARSNCACVRVSQQRLAGRRWAENASFGDLFSGGTDARTGLFVPGRLARRTRAGIEASELSGD